MSEKYIVELIQRINTEETFTDSFLSPPVRRTD